MYICEGCCGGDVGLGGGIVVGGGVVAVKILIATVSIRVYKTQIGPKIEIVMGHDARVSRFMPCGVP